MVNYSQLQDKLSSVNVVALDSMIFIYLFEKNKLFSDLTEVIFEFIEKGKIQAITSVITPLEVLSSGKLSDNQELLDSYVRFFQEEDNLTVKDLDLNICEIAAKIRRDFSLGTPDAIQLATALNSKCDIFITNDQNFKKIPATFHPKILILS